MMSAAAPGRARLRSPTSWRTRSCRGTTIGSAGMEPIFRAAALPVLEDFCKAVERIRGDENKQLHLLRPAFGLLKTLPGCHRAAVVIQSQIRCFLARQVLRSLIYRAEPASLAASNVA